VRLKNVKINNVDKNLLKKECYIMNESEILKVLNKTEKLVKEYKIAEARKILQKQIDYLKYNKKDNKLKLFIKKLKKFLKAIFQDCFNYSIVIEEPNYCITKDEFDELMYYIDNFEEIEKDKNERKLINRFKKSIY